MKLRTFAAVALLLATAACGSSGDATSTAPTPTATVDATPSLAFTPSTVKITQGGTVTFSFGTVTHNVTFDAASLAAGAPGNIGNTQNQTATLTFATVGTFHYQCTLHPGMKGTVQVVAQ